MKRGPKSKLNSTLQMKKRSLAKAKAKPGRPTLCTCTPALINEICQRLVMRGSYAAGISRPLHERRGEGGIRTLGSEHVQGSKKIVPTVNWLTARLSRNCLESGQSLKGKER